ncbi:hypothetical protein PRABACTJOHN_00058 [Parabacteroides johnsonii DSM 18315]|uniref:Uncharacterized protein n=1 Tax=Parabacteroides johnsonii DSM 18315 TaxID=537006 RepID=B7B4W6_9BACT|nr:hypothetical protein PRABACTJOHN_00058 [Parabacteroides johnsonii DSM 18315]
MALFDKSILFAICREIPADTGQENRNKQTMTDLKKRKTAAYLVSI